MRSNWPLARDDGKSMVTQAVVLGLGSMFNHSSDQNIGWERNIANEVITYRALRIIPTGEELCTFMHQHEHEQTNF
jgi:hypothetical protein